MGASFRESRLKKGDRQTINKPIHEKLPAALGGGGVLGLLSGAFSGGLPLPVPRVSLRF
nr:hypothetical protein [Candidatus Freyarchaeota archaeon]